MITKPWFRVFTLWGFPYFILPIHWKGFGLYLLLIFGWFIWATICTMFFGTGILPQRAVHAAVFIPFLIAYGFFMRTVLRHAEKNE